MPLGIQLYQFVQIQIVYHIFRLMREYPKVVLPVAYEIIKRLSSFVRNIDFALDWMVIDAGKSLYRYDNKYENQVPWIKVCCRQSRYTKGGEV